MNKKNIPDFFNNSIKNFSVYGINNKNNFNPYKKLPNVKSEKEMAIINAKKYREKLKKQSLEKELNEQNDSKISPKENNDMASQIEITDEDIKKSVEKANEINKNVSKLNRFSSIDEILDNALSNIFEK